MKGYSYYALIKGILFLIWGVINFLIGRWLWSGKYTGKILGITISSLYAIVNLISLIRFGYAGNFFILTTILINLIIAVYLLFSKSVKESFIVAGSKITLVSLTILAVVIYLLNFYPANLGAVSSPNQNLNPGTTIQKEDCGAVSLDGLMDPTKRTSQDKSSLSCFAGGLYGCNHVKISQGNLSLEVLRKEGDNCMIQRVFNSQNQTCGVPIIVINDLKKYLEQKGESVEAPAVLFASGVTQNEGTVRDLITNKDYPVNCTPN
ncbi:MAG: hypothetical protein Q7K65_04975 [Candidatus Buchananbacteria bacterium]|nr:hypothetical protein [Candidatus Buchananbacteria bacterium]